MLIHVGIDKDIILVVVGSFWLHLRSPPCFSFLVRIAHLM